MESSADKSPQHIGNVFVVHGTREKSARVCLALGELLSQEGVWLVRTLVSLGDPRVTVYVHMNDRAYETSLVDPSEDSPAFCKLIFMVTKETCAFGYG